MKLPTSLRVFFRTTEFTTVTAWIFLLHAVFCFVAFVILGASPYINATALGLTIVMDAVFFISLRRSNENVAAHLLIVAWYVLLFFCVRIAALLIFPPDTLEFPAGVKGGYLANEEVAAGLVFVVGGVVAILAGISLGGNLSSKNLASPEQARVQLSLWALTAYWALAYLAAYYVIVHLGVSIFKSPDNWGSRMAWVRIIFDTDIALMYTILWMVVQKKYFDLKKVEVLHICLLILSWITFSLLIGSRGGPFRILLFTFIAVLAIHPRFKVSIAGLVGMVGIFLVVNSYVFAIGTAFRHSQIESVSVLQSIENYHKRHMEFKNYLPKDQQRNVSDLRKAFYNSEIVRAVALRIRPTITRLAIVDYPLTIVTREPNREVIDQYIKSLHPFKNFLNSLVPGEIFEEATLNTSRVFGMAYIGKTLEDVSRNYMSEPFTLWGEAWLIAGYLGWGILLVVAVFVQAGLGFAQRKSSVAMMGGRLVYIMVVILGIYGMFGVDYWLTSVAHFSVASFIAYVFIRFFPLWKRRH